LAKYYPAKPHHQRGGRTTLSAPEIQQCEHYISYSPKFKLECNSEVDPLRSFDEQVPFNLGENPTLFAIRSQLHTSEFRKSWQAVLIRMEAFPCPFEQCWRECANAQTSKTSFSQRSMIEQNLDGYPYFPLNREQRSISHRYGSSFSSPNGPMHLIPSIPQQQPPRATGAMNSSKPVHDSLQSQTLR